LFIRATLEDWIIGRMGRFYMRVKTGFRVFI